VIFFLVNPKIWIVLGVLFVLALARRQYRSWRARRRARLAAARAVRRQAPGPGSAQGPAQARRPA
jgi:uncharacterized membrane protein